MLSLSKINNLVNYALYYANVINAIIALFGVDATVTFNYRLSPQFWCLLVTIVFLALRFQQETVINISKYRILGLVSLSCFGTISPSVPQMITGCCWVGQKLGLVSSSAPEARPEIDDLPECSETQPLALSLNKVLYGSMGTTPLTPCEVILECDPEETIGFIPFDDEVDIEIVMNRWIILLGARSPERVTQKIPNEAPPLGSSSLRTTSPWVYSSQWPYSPLSLQILFSCSMNLCAGKKISPTIKISPV
ncbi:uncharacterized protein MELLADRAFT_60511 [Melampsora larici-populina 98AG31]|uniref:Uncharacterized protein n=1 Tax=Melampsora larici-populina (strain 98AG31 / pathotype 3-4-7) TaxID=747676 RepID=F4RBG6_MELLP|nr:uncharacterized protein MELLADRAFT_60511 [Melampsora larici-populina 98AG31]EGG10364.1 hypothetical protein MELLADRAFT_60511 [Melampsora larici-populina 98AG31]